MDTAAGSFHTQMKSAPPPAKETWPFAMDEPQDLGEGRSTPRYQEPNQTRKGRQYHGKGAHSRPVCCLGQP